MILASKYCRTNACHSNGFSVGIKTQSDLSFGKITLVSARGCSIGAGTDCGETSQEAIMEVQGRGDGARRVEMRFAMGLGDILEAELTVFGSQFKITNEVGVGKDDTKAVVCTLAVHQNHLGIF